MKFNLGLFVGLLFLTSIAGASGTSCSNARLYSSQQRIDSGIPPKNGDVVGSSLVVYDGKMLAQETLIQGQTPVQAYDLLMTGAKKTLEHTGEAATGHEIYKQTAILRKKIAADKYQEIARGEVVCLWTWNYVP